MRLEQETIRSLLATIYQVVSTHTSSRYSLSEPLLLAVGTQQTVNPSLEVTYEEWENLCMECGSWEWIDGELDDNLESDGGGRKERNEFGGESGILIQQTKRNWCICPNHGALI